MVLFDRLLRRLGIKILRVQASPFESLFDRPRHQELSVELNGHAFTIVDAVSFYHSHREIFIDGIYRFNTDRERPVIIDCGSNCGTSVAYFKSIYPQACVVAVEPDPRLFEVLSANVIAGKYQDVQLLNKAVSVETGSMSFYREGADGGRLVPLESPQEVVSIETVQLDDLIDGPVDFLKMDIEGSETEVLCASRKLDKVAQLFVEYHSFKGMAQSLSDLLSVLRHHGFRYYIHHQFCSGTPLTTERLRVGQDLQLNIFAKRPA